MSRRSPLALVLGLLLPASVFAQAGITWNFSYLDAAGQGFNSTTVDAGETLSQGQLRRNSVTAATAYLSTVLDGRGSITLQFEASQSDGSGFLASYGAFLSAPSFSVGQFNNGLLYRGVRANNVTGEAATGLFDFGYGWNYAGQNAAPAGNRYDMVTVAIHEIGHALGFSSYTTQSGGSEFNGIPAGTPGTYSGYDRFLQRGNGSLATSGLFNTNIGSSGFGTFTGLANTLTNGNDTGTGLFFGGAYAREVFNGAVPLYAPAGYQPGSSTSHVNDSAAVMNPSTGPNSVKRFRAYEIAMLMDIGWNVYNWTTADGSGSGNWGDGINGPLANPTSYTLTNSRWRTNSGIVSGGGNYNTFSNPGQAPILPVNGQTTANIALNFSNTSTAGITSTNNLPYDVRLSRLTFTSTSGDGAITIAGGTLNFGLNANGSASVLVPKIVQQGSGAVTITSALRTNAIGTQTIDGVTFTGHDRISFEGAGSGLVTVSGNITGSGGITKQSSSHAVVLSGTNTYTGTTLVTGGTLYVNGNSSGATGAVTVNSGGTLSGTGTVGGATTVNGGGTIEAGSLATPVGTLTIDDSLTVAGGGTLRAQIGTGSTADLLNMSGNSGYTLTLANGARVVLDGATFAGGSYRLVDMNATAQLLAGSTAVGNDTTITTFTSSGGVGGTNVNGVGNVDLFLTGFNLGSGDQLLLRRDSFGDLVLVFTPVPEPAGVLAACGLATACGLAWRRWKGRAKTLAA
jgi:autotransporter-associated beta strand protein